MKNLLIISVLLLLGINGFGQNDSSEIDIYETELEELLKLTSTKDGKKISEETNLNKLASYISNVFPKLKDSGKKITPKNVIHKIPDNKEHIILKINKT